MIVYEAAASPDVVPSWVTSRPLWAGLGAAIGIVVAGTLVDVDALMGWVLDTIGLILLGAA